MDFKPPSPYDLKKQLRKQYPDSSDSDLNKMASGQYHAAQQQAREMQREVDRLNKLRAKADLDPLNPRKDLRNEFTSKKAGLRPDDYDAINPNNIGRFKDAA